MTDFAGLYYQIIAGSLLFIIEQILLLIVVYRDEAGWKFRFSRVEDYSDLRPVQATWRVAMVIFAISILNRKAMDEPIRILKQAIQEAKVEDEKKMRSLQRLRRFVPDNIAH